jgi:hypothetical protein
MTVSICKIIAARAFLSGKIEYFRRAGKPQNQGLSAFFTGDGFASGAPGMTGAFHPAWIGL